MLLIYPPTAKPTEPPAGIAQLAGVLKSQNISSTTLDANLEGLLYLLKLPGQATDKWSLRAYKNIHKNLHAFRKQELYKNPDRYSRAVKDLNRVLETNTTPGLSLSLANYQDKLSPLNSHDLIQASQSYTDNIFYPYFSERISKLVEKTTPPFVGFSLNYLSQAITTFAMIGFLKEFAPEIPIILGGGLITSWAQNPSWKNPFTKHVDHIIAGPGEKPLIKLFGKKFIVPHSTPDYSNLPLDQYLSPGFTLPYAGSSGCYWSKCTFCPEKAEANPYLTLATEHVRDDLDKLTSRHSPTLIHFLDNAISPALMKSLVKKHVNVPWYGFARIDKKLLNLSFCENLRDSGCIMLKLGIESGDQNVLNSMDKGIDLSTISHVLKNLRESGIATYVYLLFGTPSESIIEARRTMNFVAQHHEAITFLNLAIFNMPVCSAEAQTVSTNQFYTADLGLYTDFEHPRGWSRSKVRVFLDNEFKRHSLIRPIILRDPYIFTSNHAPFFAKKILN